MYSKLNFILKFRGNKFKYCQITQIKILYYMKFIYCYNFPVQIY